MNRLIKFRAKRHDNGAWVHGHYFTVPLTDGNSGLPQESGWYFLAGGETKHCIESGGCAFVIDLSTLGQFSGLNDREGNEIYEGDIVDFTYWWCDGAARESQLRGEIAYITEHMAFGLRGIRNEEWIRHIGGRTGDMDAQPFNSFDFDDADFAVIGNIYEHPWLMDAHVPGAER